MPSPGVQWREPLHNLRVLIGYDLVQIDDIVMAIRYVTAVDITAVNSGRICCVFHDGMSEELVVDISKMGIWGLFYGRC